MQRKLLNLQNIGKSNEKENHIGYYFISNGKEKLYNELGIKQRNLSIAPNSSKVGKAKYHPHYKELSQDSINSYCTEHISHEKQNKWRINTYIYGVLFISIAISTICGVLLYNSSKDIAISIIEALLIFIPITEITIKIVQNILAKIVKPSHIPKMDFERRDRREKYHNGSNTLYFR